ncbi:hypothetical protein [Aliarcobacter butzleri]|uniref:hypothetical protein n=1 Tax=Aliarcobacter butzleri TaxID=28197 RepID=UPI003AF33D01
MNSILIFSFLYAIFNVAGAAIIKHKLLLGRIGNFKDFILFLFDFKIILAMVFIFISMFFSIKALSFNKFSLVIPILTGINFLITVAVGYLFFKDELALSGYLGILFIIVGIYLLGLGK